MRVIGGDPGPPPGGTRRGAVRPTSDRVREAIFDILFSQGGVEGLQVVDLFAGTGALGIEALSRGAAIVTFVERDPAALAAVRANLASVGLGEAERDGDATVVRADAEPGWPRTASRYDLALVRPALRLRRAGRSWWRRLPADLAVLESGAEITAPEGWVVVKSRRYGGTIVTVARPELVTETRPEMAAEKGAS